MMLVLALLTALPASTPVRAELVEAPSSTFPNGLKKNGPSTGSGRTEVGSQTALDAERAFAADAQTLGQWTAFRKWAAPDATMFVPEPINAQAWLKDRKDPLKAIAWWPTASYVSCDGSLAVNTGGWKRPDGADGYFSTVWQRQPDGGWKWIVDGGDELKVARPRGRPVVRRASCELAIRVHSMRLGDDGGGASADRSLGWYWHVDKTGAHRFTATLWTGSRYERIVDDEIAPAK